MTIEKDHLELTVCLGAFDLEIVSYFQSNDRLTKTQSRNKKCHSTVTAVTEPTDTILRAIDQKMLTSAMFLDMSKAFDSVNHETLTLKLQDVGVSNSVRYIHKVCMCVLCFITLSL